MTRRVQTLRAAGLALLAVTVAAAPARAEFSPPELVTTSSRIQLGGSSLTLSADGSTAVFSTLSDVLLPAAPANERWSGGGLFVRTIATGDIELVVPATIEHLDDDPGTGPGQIAGGAAVSATGRFVAFSTSAALVAQDDNLVNDVYVRDLSRKLTDPGALRLVSARGPQDEPLAYAPDESAPVAGSTVGPSGISDDGQRVAFTVDAASDLGGASTPAGQVAVRDLSTGELDLVARTLDGARAPAQQQPADVEISGDGTTVMWLARRASEQVRLGPEQADGTTPAQDQFPQLLWRRLDAPTTRLVFGVSDPDDPGCRDDQVIGTTPEARPCDGPVRVPSGQFQTATSRLVDSASMSRDGRTVALVSAGNRLDVDGAGDADAYLVTMADGLTRKQAARRLTRGADATQDAAAGEIALSPDATFVLVTASRWSAAAAPPAPIGQFPAAPTGTRIGYGIDLPNDTIELISRGYSGDGALAAISAPVVSNAGQVAGYVSAANNLVYGDANGTPEPGSGADAFVQRRIIRDAAPGPVVLPPVRLAESVAPAWRLGISARPRRDGGVRVSVRTPAAGQLTIRSVPTSPAGSRRRIAATTATAAGSGVTSVVLRPRGRDARAARRTRGLATAITITFTPTTGTPLRSEIRARYRKRTTR
jgi:hypothetical protein